MIRIDEKYDVVLTYSPIPEITGHLFECFDYYLFLRQFYKVGIVFIDSLPEDKVRTAFESKYTLEYGAISPDCTFISSEDLRDTTIVSFGRNTVVILTDGNIKSLEHRKIILATTRLYGFMCGDYEFHLMKTNRRITYLQDYRIYGRNRNFRSFDYVKKLPFKFYRKSSRKFDNTGLMYVTYACRKVTPQVIQDYHEMSGCDRTLLVVPYKLPEYDCIDGVCQVLAPLADFFDRFDTYIYTPVHRKFDCSPRLVTECSMQGKRIFMRLDYVDIGLETRLNDCRHNLEGLNLTDGDPILDIIDQELSRK